MKLVLSLSVLAVALLMVLEGPAPAQAESGIMDNLQKLGSSMKDKVQQAIGEVKKSDPWIWISEKFDKVMESIKNPFS